MKPKTLLFLLLVTLSSILVVACGGSTSQSTPTVSTYTDTAQFKSNVWGETRTFKVDCVDCSVAITTDYTCSSDNEEMTTVVKGHESKNAWNFGYSDGSGTYTITTRSDQRARCSNDAYFIVNMNSGGVITEFT